MILWYGLDLGPGSGFGPYWDLYPKAFDGCHKHWWTNIFYLQNLYPSNFDEKCMGWTWFVACYMQLSLALPLFLTLYTFLPRKVSIALVGTLMVALTVINFLFVKNSGTGIFLTFDDGVYLNFEFLSQIFMKPYFHMVSYLWGMILSLIYMSYVKDRVYNPQSPSFTTRILLAIRDNAILRYSLYFVAFSIMTLVVFGLHPYIKDNTVWSPTVQALYAALGYPAYVFGASLFLLCAVLGRAEFVRFFFGGEIWTLFKSMSYGLYMFMPLYALNYFFSMSNSQHLDY